MSGQAPGAKPQQHQQQPSAASPTQVTPNGTDQSTLSGGAGGSAPQTTPTCSGSCGAQAADASASSKSKPAKAVDMGHTAPSDLAADQDLDCQEFRVHGEAKVGDTSPFQVPAGELYRCFYFASPWTTEQQGVRVEWAENPVPVVHHSLLYGVGSGYEPNSIQECAGLHFDGVLMPAFGIDQLPSDTGFQIPGGSGQMFMLEMHYINTGGPATDSTAVKLCATRTKRANTATLTWLGTENLGGVMGMPPHAQSTFSGTCSPGRTGLAASDDVHLLMLVPHMHQLGTRSQTVLHRVAGGTEMLLDAPYDYASPQVYRLDALLHAGDTLETSCVFNNTTDNYVAFGPTLTDEMCYNFALAYPPTALDHQGASLVGAMDTCLW
jgi:hypothetical protein